jgi:hypothetical protein
MSWFRHWFTRTRQARRPPARRPGTYRPHLESLEKREVPTVTRGNLSGPLLYNVGVEAVFYGQAWQHDPGLNRQVGTLTRYLQDLVGGSYMDMLNQAGYGVGRGSYLDGLYDNSNLPGGINDGQIQQELAWLINNNYLRYPDANRLYAIFVQPGVEVTRDNENSGLDAQHSHFLGYHSMFHLNGSSQQVYYAVLPYQGGVNGQVRGAPSPLDGITEATSHEVAEAVTDPDTYTGWRDYAFQGPNEIGDLANLQFGWWNGWLVQKEADRNDRAMAPAGFSTSPWGLTSPGTVQDFDVTTDAAGNAVVVGLGQDKQVWIESPGHPWSLTHLGMVQQARITRDARGWLTVFAIGLDSQVWAETSPGDGSWTPWAFVTAGAVKQLSATRDTAGNPEVFAIGLDNQVYVESGGSGWSLTTPGQVLAISAITDAAGNPEVFAIGMDYQVWAERPGASWSLTTPGRVQALSATVDANGNPEVFAVGMDSAIYLEASTSSGQWTGWSLTRSGQVNDLCVIPDGNKRDVYVRGLDNQIWEESFGVY